MNKVLRISEYTKQLFSAEREGAKAGEILEGILAARSRGSTFIRIPRFWKKCPIEQPPVFGALTSLHQTTSGAITAIASIAHRFSNNRMPAHEYQTFLLCIENGLVQGSPLNLRLKFAVLL